MDLIERARLALNLADHLSFMNDEVQKSHCDIKPDNYMLTQLFTRPKNGDHVVSALSMLLNDMQSYKSKLIDFGGVVDRNTKCTTYTSGFVPFDDILKNGSVIHPSVDSSKNDIFAYGTILVYVLTKDRPLDLLKMNIAIHNLLKNLNTVENQIYIERTKSNPKELQNQLKDFGWQGIRNVSIIDILPKLVETFGDLLTPFKQTWEIISNQEDIEDEEFIKQIYSSDDKFIDLLDSLYQTYFLTIRTDRNQMAKFEMMRLMTSSGLTLENYDDYVSDVMQYVQYEEHYLDILITIFSFKKSNRPDWDTVISQFTGIEVEISKLFEKINKKAKQLAKKRFRGPNPSVYKDFMIQVNNGSIELLEELKDTQYRILTSSTTQKSNGLLESQNKIIQIIQNDSTVNNSDIIHKTYKDTQLDLNQMIINEIQKQNSTMRII